MRPQGYRRADLSDIAGLEQQHREELQRLTEEHSQEMDRMRCGAISMSIPAQQLSNAKVLVLVRHNDGKQGTIEVG